MRFDGEVAIITGAGRGLGRAFALGLAREGARIVVAELDPRSGESVAREIVDSGGHAIATVTDVSDVASTEAMAAQALERFGRIDILVNNAANAARRDRPWEDITPDEWSSYLAVILTGSYLCARAVWPAMKRNGWGKIINISSATILFGRAGWLAYTSAKAGLVGFTRTLAREVGDYGVCVNVITPGSTRHEATVIREWRQERDRELLKGRCIKRLGVAEDLVGAVLFLASHESDFITGQLLNVDGGFAMH